jgi:hypothetical protein
MPHDILRDIWHFGAKYEIFYLLFEDFSQNAVCETYCVWPSRKLIYVLICEVIQEGVICSKHIHFGYITYVKFPLMGTVKLPQTVGIEFAVCYLGTDVLYTILIWLNRGKTDWARHDGKNRQCLLSVCCSAHEWTVMYFDHFSLQKETPPSSSPKTLTTVGLRKEWDWLQPYECIMKPLSYITSCSQGARRIWREMTRSSFEALKWWMETRQEQLDAERYTNWHP